MLFIFLIGSLLIPINALDSPRDARNFDEHSSLNLNNPIDLNMPPQTEADFLLNRSEQGSLQRNVRQINPRLDRNREGQEAKERENARIQAERNKEKRDRLERDQRFTSRRSSPFIDDRRGRIMDIDLERDRREDNDRSRLLDRQREIERDQQIENDRRKEIERDRIIEMDRRREIERDREVEFQRKRAIEREEDQKRKEYQQIEAQLEQRREQEQHEEINREVNKAIDMRKELKRLADSKADFLLNRSEQGSLESNWKEDTQRDVRHINSKVGISRVEQEANERENARIQAERNKEKRDRLRNDKYKDIDQNIGESRRRESRIFFNDNVRNNEDDIIDHYKVTGDKKAPILILEKVEVPVPVEVTPLRGGVRSNLPDSGVDTRSSGSDDRNIWFGSTRDDLDRRPARHPFQAGVPPGQGFFQDGYGPHPLDPQFPPFDPTHGLDELHVHTYEEGGIRDPRLIGPLLPQPHIAEQLHLQRIAIQNQVGQALLVDQALKHHAAGAAAAGAQQAAAGVHQAVIKQAAAAGVQQAVANAGVQHAAAAEHTATKLHAVQALKNALKTKIKEKLKHNLEVASAVAGQNAIRKQHATDLAVALHHVPQDPTNLALHIAEVKHHYDKARKELLRRLILLKPYFLRSGGLDYSMPNSLPNLPTGVLNLTPLQVQQLPLIPIQHPLSLVGPAFHLPNSLRGSLGPTIDEKYIEYILKLPDNIFRVITHMTKREFLVTLFPRLYHESVDAINHSKNDIYGPPKPTSLPPIYVPAPTHAPVTIPPYTEIPITNPPYKHIESSYVTPEPSYSNNHNVNPIKFPGPSSSYGPPPTPPPSSYGHPPPPPSPIYGAPHAPSPAFSVPAPHIPTVHHEHKPTVHHEHIPTVHHEHIPTVHHEHIHHHHQVPPGPSIINGGGHSQVTTPVPLGEHHTTTILHQGNFVPVVTAPPNPVVDQGVHVRSQGHPLVNPRSPVIPVTEQHIHITTIRPPLTPIARLIPSPQDKHGSPFVTTQVPVTTTYQPFITTTNPPISTVYNPVITTTYKPPIPTVYNTIITTTQSPPIPTVYNPVITTPQNLPTSTIYNPIVTTTYNPPVTTPYDPVTASYLPVNTTPNNPFFPINTTPIPPVTTTYQPRVIVNTAVPLIPTSIQPVVTTFFEEFPDASDIPDIFRTFEEIPIDPNTQFGELELDNFEIDRQRPLGTDSHDDSHQFQPFANVQRQGEGLSKEVTHHFRNGQHPSLRRTPMPKKIGPNGLPFQPLSHRRIPGAVPQNPPPPRPITQADLARLPAYLRKAPSCASHPTNRSFCLMPAEYPTEIANTIARKYDRELRELRSILQQIPPIDFDLEKAAEQFPNINKNIKCESEERTVVLSWSRDVLGSWFTIFQTAPLQQEVTVTTCSAAAKSLGCRPLLRPRPLVAFHPRDSEPRPLVFEFPMPIACVAVTSDLQSAASSSSVKISQDQEQSATNVADPTTGIGVNQGQLDLTTFSKRKLKEVKDNEIQPSFKLIEIQQSTTTRPSHSLLSSTDITIVSFNIPPQDQEEPPSARQPKSLRPDIVQDNLQIDLIPTATDEEKGQIIDLPPSLNESKVSVSGGTIFTSNFHFILILLIFF